jgi:serine protease SohB
VLDFKGSMDAHEVGALREEITAVLTLVKPEDQVVLRLESPGGVVHGYGLAASQLQRLRDKQVPLTVAVDKVAASGGYMMACVADKIVAAPFSIIGSIGVVAQIPNFNRFLKSKEIDIELHTAGQFKRTLTLLGENTEEGGRNSARASMKRMTCLKALSIRCARNWI